MTSRSWPRRRPGGAGMVCRSHDRRSAAHAAGASGRHRPGAERDLLMAHRPLVLPLLVLVLGAAAWQPGAARADGDPASDVLLGANVFYPYSPPVSSVLQRTLNGETAAAARAHFHLKVALIVGGHELGVVLQMFG